MESLYHSLGDSAGKVPLLSVWRHNTHNKMVNNLGVSLAIFPYSIRNEALPVSNASVYLPSSVDGIAELRINEFLVKIGERLLILRAPDL